MPNTQLSRRATATLIAALTAIGFLFVSSAAFASVISEDGTTPAMVAAGDKAQRDTGKTSDVWEPCAKQDDGPRLQLCPEAASPAATVDTASEQRAQTRRSRCGSHERHHRAVKPHRVFIALLVTWYALGLLVAVLLVIRRRDE